MQGPSHYKKLPRETYAIRYHPWTLNAIHTVPLCFSIYKYFSVSVQFSCSVMSDSLRLHEPQHTRPPCPLRQWCHSTISSSVIPFSCCPQSFPASGSFQMSQLFASGAQSIGVLASTSVPPMNTQDWSPLGWTGWIFLQSKSLLQHHTSKASIILCSAFFIVTSIHDRWKKP